MISCGNRHLRRNAQNQRLQSIRAPSIYSGRYSLNSDFKILLVPVRKPGILRQPSSLASSRLENAQIIGGRLKALSGARSGAGRRYDIEYPKGIITGNVSSGRFIDDFAVVRGGRLSVIWAR